MGLYPDAVVYPRAMMVEPVYTTIADVTVPRSGCPDNFTFGAKAVGLKLLKQL